MLFRWVAVAAGRSSWVLAGLVLLLGLPFWSGLSFLLFSGLSMFSGLVLSPVIGGWLVCAAQ
jgi:hypothetical protein